MEAFPFLSIVTRTCRRPELLTQNIQSVMRQTCQDIEQVFLVDKTGSHPEGNILWANMHLIKCRERAIGRYVFILDDDGVLIDPTFVERLKEHADKMGYPDVILTRSRPAAHTKLPPDHIWNIDWETWERPATWKGHAYNWVVSNEWWQVAIQSWSVPHGGDWHFGTSLIKYGAEIVRMHGIYSARSIQRGYGRKFEKCTRGWFERVMREVGATRLDQDDWRLQLWLK
jgi:hypothetical protein